MVWATVPPFLSVRSVVRRSIRLSETVSAIWDPVSELSLPSKLAVYWTAVRVPSALTPSVVDEEQGGLAPARLLVGEGDALTYQRAHALGPRGASDFLVVSHC